MMKLILLYLATVLVLLQRTGGCPARTVNVRKGKGVRTVLESGADVEALLHQHTGAGRGKPGAPWRQGELDLPPTTVLAVPTARGWVSAGPGEGGPQELKYYISLHEKPYFIV